MLVIKGAQYFDGESILIPHFTGEFYTVDCTEYALKKELKQNYSKEWIKKNKDDYIEHNGEKYYYAEYGSFYIDNWKLLSDLSDL